MTLGVNTRSSESGPVTSLLDAKGLTPTAYVGK